MQHLCLPQSVSDLHLCSKKETDSSRRSKIESKEAISSARPCPQFVAFNSQNVAFKNQGLFTLKNHFRNCNDCIFFGNTTGFLNKTKDTLSLKIIKISSLQESLQRPSSVPILVVSYPHFVVLKMGNLVLKLRMSDLNIPKTFQT